MSVQDFQVVKVADKGVIRPSLLDACLKAVDDYHLSTQGASAKQVKVEYIRNPYCAGRSSVLVPVALSLHRQQDMLGRTCVTR